MSIKHGHAKRGEATPTYVSWKAMRNRCNNPEGSDFDNYGGRDIKVCPAWDDFTTFLADMGEAPEGFTIERNDVHGDYEPENCRWASRSDQSRNTRRTRWVVLNGEAMVLKDAAAAIGVTDCAIINEVKRKGITYQEALDNAINRPKNKQRRK